MHIRRRSGVKGKLGVRHLQLLFVTFQGFVDNIALEGTRKWLEDTTVDFMDGSGNQERVATGPEIQHIEAFLYLISTITRLFTPFVVLTVNNKYFSIGLSFIEVAAHIGIPKILSLPRDKRAYGLGSLTALIIICQVMRYPIALSTIAKWIPPREITRAISVVEAGDFFGRSMSRYIMMSPFVKRNMFYMLGVGKILHIVMYFFFGAQDPQTCWILPKGEWHYLCREIGIRRKITCHFHIPWGSIFRVPMLYGLMCSAIAFRWFYIDFSHFESYVPGYEDAVHISMFFYPFISFFCAWGIDVMIARDMITRNNIRKIWHSVAFWGCSICICFMCFYSREPGKVVVHFIFASMFGFSYSLSGITAALDMTPNYALVLQSLYTFPAMCVGAIKALFFDPDDDKMQGTLPFRENLYVWYTVAFIMFVFNYGFLMLGDIQWCQFDSYDAVDWRQESVISYP